MEGSGAEIRHQGFKAFYSPPNDLIYLPGRPTFADAAAYYSTALHELCHWTGATTRLGRKLGRRFGESAYAMEELIAELGAAFLSAHCRLDGRLQHASYIASWLEVLQRDKRAVFVAAAQAQKAADYLLEHAGLLAPSGGHAAGCLDIHRYCRGNLWIRLWIANIHRLRRCLPENWAHGYTHNPHNLSSGGLGGTCSLNSNNKTVWRHCCGQ